MIQAGPVSGAQAKLMSVLRSVRTSSLQPVTSSTYSTSCQAKSQYKRTLEAHDLIEDVDVLLELFERIPCDRPATIRRFQVASTRCCAHPTLHSL